MASARLVVDLFCEDLGHEQFATALLERLAVEEQVALAIRARSARGGLGRALTELRAFQQAVAAGLSTGADLLVVVIDGNAVGWKKRRAEIQEIVDQSIFPVVVAGCPDPYIEAWCFADPEAVRKVTDRACPAFPRSAKPDFKKLLRRTLEAAEFPILGDPMDYAGDFVAAIDFYRAGKKQPAFQDFCTDLRAALRQLAERTQR